MVMKLSVTMIESYRYARAIEDEDKREQQLQELVDRVRGVVVPPTVNMEIGTAFDAVMCDRSNHLRMYEDSHYYSYSRDYVFDGEVIDGLYRKHFDTQTVFQIPIKKRYSVDNSDVVVSGRIDAMNGLFVHDIKTKLRDKPLTAREYDIMFDGYMDSVQWMFYLDMTGLNRFRYNVFMFDNALDLLDDFTLDFRQFNRMSNVLQEAIDDFVMFIRNNELERYLLYGESTVNNSIDTQLCL